MEARTVPKNSHVVWGHVSLMFRKKATAALCGQGSLELGVAMSSWPIPMTAMIFRLWNPLWKNFERGLSWSWDVACPGVVAPSCPKLCLGNINGSEILLCPLSDVFSFAVR